MKTALHTLKERLEKDKEIFPELTEYIDGIIYDIDNELLEKEKQQIIEAVKYGQNNHSVSITHEENIAINYYNERFN